ncbi:MAG TPA: hypothetical protein VN151_05305 [Terracidiphilus sp.]|nr:hypothetical protein [Terracidiphilus sp.]
MHRRHSHYAAFMSGSAAVAKYESFASALAGFTASSRPAATLPGDGLEDDIATITYEKALRSKPHKRSTAKSPSPRPNARTTASTRKQPVSIRGGAIQIAQPAHAPAPAPAPHRRSSRVSVGLTAVEHAQLLERAAAAGISASAYLRSCLVEAEDLRAQVRDALEQFRASATPVPQAAPEPEQERRPSFMARLLGRLRR